jgi:AraC-like DNA-binding protein
VEALAARYTRQSFELHRHDGFLVGVIESGAHAVWCRGERHLAGPGTLATMDPCEVHHGGAGHPDGWRQRILYVSPTSVAEVLEDAVDSTRANRAPHFRQCFGNDEALVARFLEVHRMLSDPAVSALERQSRFEALLAAVFLRHAEPKEMPDSGGGDDLAVERVRDYMHAHLTDPCPLPDLARVAGLRRRRLVDSFARRFALPPHRYLIQLRIDAARPLLANGLSPAEVAAALGFSDQSHFIRRFKAVVGVTPGRWQLLNVGRRT